MADLIVTPTDSPDNPTIEYVASDVEREMQLLSEYFAELMQAASRTAWDFCACCWSRVCSYDEDRGPVSVFCPGCNMAIDAVLHTCAGNRDIALDITEMMATWRDRLGDGVSSLDHVHELATGPLREYLKSNSDVSAEGLFTAIALDRIENMPDKDQYAMERSSAVILHHILEMGDILEKRADIAGQYDRLSKQTLKHTAILLSGEIARNIAYVWSLFPLIHPREFLRIADSAIHRIFSHTRSVFDEQDVWHAMCFDSMPRHDEILRWMPYERYLKTFHWQETRASALDRAGNRCQVCNTTRGLHVHHRTYERRGAELPEDLIVLCRDCHSTFHKNGRLAR